MKKFIEELLIIKSCLELWRQEGQIFLQIYYWTTEVVETGGVQGKRKSIVSEQSDQGSQEKRGNQFGQKYQGQHGIKKHNCQRISAQTLQSEFVL